MLDKSTSRIGSQKTGSFLLKYMYKERERVVVYPKSSSGQNSNYLLLITWCLILQKSPLAQYTSFRTNCVSSINCVKLLER